MKRKKIAAMTLALILIFQTPLCAPAHAFFAPGLLPEINLARGWDGSDWFELLAHFSAFTGLSYWIGSSVHDAYVTVSGIEDLWDLLSLLFRHGLIPRWYYEFAPEPPGSFSI
ncbi:hypothetical protein [Cloacibacillus sp. An23]|uniref:hypothetical protein n=1 Tax=Cloacibacillus sp. An23 TaxID=1965591 RepID=UPI0011778F8D|nr:hypothetical protein [Cloacibacillus sp. An23]